MTIIKDLTPREVKELQECSLPAHLAEQIPANTLVPIRMEWEYVYDSDMVTEYDDCLRIEEPSIYERNQPRRVDINETYRALIEVGGCTPESARKQTAYMMERFRTWQQDQWHYGGLCVTLYAHTPANPGARIQIAGDSLWGIESDSPARFIRETLEDLRLSVTKEAVEAGYSAETVDALDLEECDPSRADDQQGLLNNYPARPWGDRVYGSDAEPLPELPEFSDPVLRDFEFYWVYNRNDVEIKARCTQCDSVFRGLDFSTPEHTEQSKDKLTDMDRHLDYCRSWSEDEWDQFGQ